MTSQAITPESILPALLRHLPPSGSARLNHLFRDARKDPSFQAETPKRICSLLDAIASISVENLKGDVVAVALDRGEDPSIFVAFNTGVSRQLVAHLTSVWALVCQISNRVPADQESPTQVDKIFNDNNITKLNHQLIIQVYRFSWRKFHARFWKRAEAFIRGLTLATQWFSDKPKMVEVLRHCNNLLVIFKSLCNGIVLPCPNDATLVNIHRTCAALARSLEPHLSAPHSYLATIQGYIDLHLDPGTFIPVRRYLEKIVSLTRSQHTLFLAAQSRTLKPFLSNPLKIVSIPPCTDRGYRADFYHPAFRKFCQDHITVMEKIEGDLRQQKVTTKFSELSNNLRDIVLDEEWEKRMVTPLKAALRKEKNSAIKADKRGLYGHARVHCECLLVAHFVKNRASLQPYDYIGLSELMCYGCHSYFRAYNAIQNTAFYARGSHGKVYIPWVPPTLEDGSENDVRARMCEFMLRDLRMVWSSYHQRTSDSTDASGSGDMIPMDEGVFASEDILAEHVAAIFPVHGSAS